MKLICALLLAAAVSCPQPKPTPTPTPTPEPTPEPTPTPTPPEPTPEPTPPMHCTAPLTGTPEMGAYWYSPWGRCDPGPRCIADATPRLISAERCNEVGYPGRIKCPVVPDEHPERGVCETVLMGGSNPVWQLEGDASLKVTADPWKAWVTGEGSGRIRACYPNGRACSPWLEVVR